MQVNKYAKYKQAPVAPPEQEQEPKPQNKYRKYLQPVPATADPIDPLAPKKGEEWRKVDRTAPSSAAPASPFLSPEVAAQRMKATAELRKAEQENAAFRAKRGPAMNAVSDTILGAFNAGDKALSKGSTAVMDTIDPERKGSQFISDVVTPFAGQNPNNDVVRFIPDAAARIAEDPYSGTAELVDAMEPTHLAGRGLTSLKDAAGAAVSGDMAEAQRKYSQATPDLLMGTLGVTPFGSAVVNTARNAVTKPGSALRAQVARAAEGFDAVKAAEAAPQPSPAPVVEPTATQEAPAPFSAPPEPMGRGVVRRNLDRIVGGGVGAVAGGTGDAAAAPDDGGSGSGFPGGAATGAAIGIFGPRALASVSSRGWRYAARTAQRPASRAAFDERVAARAVRKALLSGGIKSDQDALNAARAKFGDKPASVADLTQEGVGTTAGISRLPGATGDAARARGEDLIESRSGRLARDVEQSTGFSTAAVSGDIEQLAKEAMEKATPEYEALRKQYPQGSLNSPRLIEIEGIGQHTKAVDDYRAATKANEGRTVGDFEYWDLVKRDIDAKEQQLINSGATMDDIRLRKLESARAALVKELDDLIPDYAAARQLGGEAPKIGGAFKEGQTYIGGRYSADEVAAKISEWTGAPLTAAQSGAIRTILGKTEGAGAAVAALRSPRAKKQLEAVFGKTKADEIQARFAADATIVQNASRMNPNVGSVTSQAGMGGGGGVQQVAELLQAGWQYGTSPFRSVLAAISKSGSYTKAQRDLMGQMLLDGVTPENVARIFAGKKPRGGTPTSAPTGPAGPTTGLGGPASAAPRPPEKMGFGVGSSKGLRAAAIRYKGKVFSAETHDQALLDAEAAGVPIGKERIEEGFIGSNGKFVDRSDPNAALDALSAGQISDPTFRRMIEDKIRRGEAVSLVSDQVKLGSSKSLPMDEASRMGRRKEWQAEKGPVEDKTWFHSDSQGFDSVDPTKGELGLHVGDKFAADLISHRTKRARRWSSEDGRVAEPNMHEMFVRGNFASAPDLHNFASPLRYLEARMSPSKAAEFDSRYDKMWKQLDEQAREIYSRNGDDPAAWKSWRDAVHTSARDNKISGWEYANQYEAGVSRVIFDPTAARRTDATFDPSQSGSSKLLAGMGASPEAVGGIGGGVAGYFGAQDTNDDGVVDASERAAQGLGGLASGVVGAKIARTGVNKARGAFKPQSELMAAKGSYGARPSAMGDLTGHQAAQKQLKELETYRKTAPASEHAAVDQEIADLRQFLEGNGLGKRMVAGGAIGGIAGLAGTAESQTPETSAKIADNAAQTDAILADIKKIESDMRAYEGGDPLEMQKTLNRRSTDGSFIQEDGNIGPETTAAIARDKTAALAALKEKRERLTQLESTGKELEKQAAFERTRPTDDQQAFRDYAPLLGGIAGATGAKLARIGGTTVSKFTAKSSIKKANSLLSNAPISPPKTVADRAAIRERATNINEFWHRGGAKTKVPFESKRDGTWVARPTKDVTPPSALFPDKFVGRKVGAMDALIGGSSATEAVLAGQNAEIIKDKLKTAYETANEDPSEKNLARVQELEDQYAQAKGLMMLGIGAGIGTGIGVMTSKYASKRANIQLAEQELSILRQHFASQKKQGSNLGAKSKPKSSTTPPLPPSRPRKTQRPPNP